MNVPVIRKTTIVGSEGCPSPAERDSHVKDTGQ